MSSKTMPSEKSSGKSRGYDPGDLTCLFNAVKMSERPKTTDTDEKIELCELVLHAFETLVESFPDHARPSFWYNKQGVLLHYPYERSTRSSHSYHGRPDIVMSFPGQSKDAFLSPSGIPCWHKITLSIHVYAEEDLDASITYRESMQSAVCLRSAHFASDVFVITVSSRQMLRIWQFRDGTMHCATVPNCAQNMDKVKEFFLAQFCGADSAPGNALVLGHDPALRRASMEDIMWAEEVLKKGDHAPMTDEDRLGCRWIAIKEKGKPPSYALIVRVMFIKPMMDRKMLVACEVIYKGDNTDKVHFAKFYI